MDGLEAARRIRALNNGREVKIVAITASVFKEEIDSVRAAGMDDLIRKPYRSEQVYDCLTRYLGVTFVREDAPPRLATEPSAALRPEALASLSDALRGELGDALVSLDAARIFSVIGGIAELNPELGAALSKHASQFDYTLILQALQAGARNGSERRAA
jgi:CheY-like chemotaxis protein